MSECIHGLDEHLCDICTPTPTPEAPPRAERPRTSRTTSSLRTSAGRTATTRTSTARVAGVRASAPLGKPVDVATHRIFHITHIDNLERIAAEGSLLGDTAGAEPAFDLAAADHREARRGAALPTLPSASDDAIDDTAEVAATVVADCVPFYATPESRMWQDIRDGSPDPRLSAAARGANPADMVFLATTIAQVQTHAPLVLALDDAAVPTSPATADPEAIRRELRRLIALDQADDDVSTLAAVELLAAGRIPLSAISLIGVANSKVRDRVRAILADAGVTVRVAMHPPWFMRG